MNRTNSTRAFSGPACVFALCTNRACTAANYVFERARDTLYAILAIVFRRITIGTRAIQDVVSALKRKRVFWT